MARFSDEGTLADARRHLPRDVSDIAAEAEALIRRLHGVASASVHLGPRGIDAVHVTAEPHAARALAGQIRSALLAGLALPVLPAHIHVRGPEPHSVHAPPAQTPHPDTATSAEPVTAGQPGFRPDHRVRLVEHQLDLPDHDGPRPGRHAPGHTSHATPQPAPLSRPRLVAVDVERRPDSRVRCRVAVAYCARVRRAEAVALDLPGAAAQAAAQAAVRALGDAGIGGLELNGLREVEIAGRLYVVVALRRTDSSVRFRSGSAPVVESPERAAAQAAVAAADDLI
jgi:hypothetical protein